MKKYVIIDSDEGIYLGCKMDEEHLRKFVEHIEKFYTIDQYWIFTNKKDYIKFIRSWSCVVDGKTEKIYDDFKNCDKNGLKK